MTDVKGSILGNAVLRREDPTLLTGEDKYFDDMEIDGLGFVYFARSPVAHANILSIDTTEAKEVEGVVGVWTADDLELSPYLAFPLFPPHFARPPLAKGKVRLVGDIIAVVVADSFAAAADAASALQTENLMANIMIVAQAPGGTPTAPGRGYTPEGLAWLGYSQEWEIDQLLQFCRCNFIFLIFAWFFKAKYSTKICPS